MACRYFMNGIVPYFFFIDRKIQQELSSFYFFGLPSGVENIAMYTTENLLSDKCFAIIELHFFIVTITSQTVIVEVAASVCTIYMMYFIDFRLAVFHFDLCPCSVGGAGEEQ